MRNSWYWTPMGASRYKFGYKTKSDRGFELYLGPLMLLRYDRAKWVASCKDHA